MKRNELDEIYMYIYNIYDNLQLSNIEYEYMNSSASAPSNLCIHKSYLSYYMILLYLDNILLRRVNKGKQWNIQYLILMILMIVLKKQTKASSHINLIFAAEILLMKVGKQFNESKINKVTHAMHYLSKYWKLSPAWCLHSVTLIPSIKIFPWSLLHKHSIRSFWSEFLLYFISFKGLTPVAVQCSPFILRRHGAQYWGVDGSSILGSATYSQSDFKGYLSFLLPQFFFFTMGIIIVLIS